MKNKKVLTKQDVKNVAKLLMKINNSTTTLDVKEELRGADYFAKQEDISILMDELSSEESWSFDSNGTHRTYYKDASIMQDSLSDSDNDDNKDADNLDLTAGIPKNNFWDGLNNDDDDDNDSKTIPNSVLSFDKNLTFNQRSGRVIVGLDAKSLPDKYWKVSSSISDKIIHFENKLNREEVRYAYYKLTGLSKGSSYKAEKINF